MSVVARFEIPYRQYLDADGKAVGDWPDSAGSSAELAKLFERMLFVRTFDEKAVKLQRTGKLGTYASCLGHEAAHIAIGDALRPDDVFAPMYREYGAQFMRGVKPREVLLYWGGDERGNDFSGPAHDYAWCVPIATQCLHAAGAALAMKLRGSDSVALTVCGDGGSSKTDFYGAINSAGAYRLPLIAVIVNNQWAISVPRSAQTGAETLAQKGVAAGLDCQQVDGNDLVAMRVVLAESIARARAGDGGTVIEAVTYRLSDHTTADDARRYREADEVEAAWTREPFLRLRKYLAAQGVWDEAHEKALVAGFADEVDTEVNAYLETKTQGVEAMFDFLYAELPEDLVAQRQAVIEEAR